MKLVKYTHTHSFVRILQSQPETKQEYVRTWGNRLRNRDHWTIAIFIPKLATSRDLYIDSGASAVGAALVPVYVPRGRKRGRKSNSGAFWRRAVRPLFALAAFGLKIGVRSARGASQVPCCKTLSRKKLSLSLSLVSPREHTAFGTVCVLGPAIKSVYCGSLKRLSPPDC